MSGREINDYAEFTPLPFSPYLDLRHCDCMEYMRGLPDKAFALAIVDPPYGIARLSVNENRDPSSKFRRSMAKMVDSAKRWNGSKPTPEYFKELFRVSVNQIVWGANNFTMPTSEYFCVWDKQQTVDNFASAEYAWVSMGLKKPAKVFRFSIHQHNADKGRIHPTQKPVALYRWLLANYAHEGDNILDTHMGSGSIAIACHYAGYKLTACELDAEYYRDALERVERETRQQTLFTPPIAEPEQEHGCELL